MVWRHAGERHRDGGDIGGVVEIRHGVSSRVLLRSRLGFLAARPVGIALVVVDGGRVCCSGALSRRVIVFELT